MNKLLKILLACILVISLTGCQSQMTRPKVVIYSSSENYRNEYLQKRLDEQFPQYDIFIQYISTGNSAARLKSEGKKIEADIILELETTYLEQLKDMLVTLDDYDFSRYLDELVPSHKKYAPWYRISGAIIVNREVLKSKGLAVPNCYEDLLKPEYKNLISMPSPKASSTGYMFLKNIVNVMGETQAFKYFDELSKNILQFTSSGSGPVKALLQKEAGIGLGITYQAVNEINHGVNLDILFFKEGAPYTTAGFAMVEGHQDKKGVKEVFDYLYNTLIYEDKEKFAPEQIFKGQVNHVENYPKNINYANMSNNTESERLRLLRKWEY